MKLNNKQEIVASIFIIGYSCSILYFYIYYKMHHQEKEIMPLFINIIKAVSLWALPFFIVALWIIYLLRKNRENPASK